MIALITGLSSGFTPLPPDLEIDTVTTPAELPYGFRVVSAERDPSESDYAEVWFALNSRIDNLRAGPLEIGFRQGGGEIVLSATVEPTPVCGDRRTSMYKIGLDAAVSDSVVLQVLYYEGEAAYGSKTHRWVLINTDLLFEPETPLECE
jgi:hypothetical protein